MVKLNSHSPLDEAIYYVELKRWGIKNDGTDPVATTIGINDAIDWAYNNDYSYVKFPAGTYLISKGSAPYYNAGAWIYDTSREACIHPKSNMTLDFRGCIIKKETNSYQGYRIVEMKYCNNVTVLGGNFEGDLLTHDYSNNNGIHEGNIGISINEGCRNIVLDGVEIRYCAGYGLNLTGGGRQLLSMHYNNFESGAINADGNLKEDNTYIRTNMFIMLERLHNLPSVNNVPAGGTDSNGGIFSIWGNGYGTNGIQYDGTPYQLSFASLELHFYDDDNNYKGVLYRRMMDDISLQAVPSGATKFKIAVKADINKVIPETFMMQIWAYNPSRSIVVRNCKIHHGYSLGIAITGSQHVIVENNHFYMIGWSNSGNGDLPGVGKTLYPFPMGIDIEDMTQMNQNITIRNNRFTDIQCVGVSTVNARNVLIENNYFDGVGVVFQGTRGINLVSQNNFYFRTGARGQGNPLFINDTFMDGSLYISNGGTYQRCLFRNSTIQVNHDDYESYITGKFYALGNSIVPSNFNGYYYVMSSQSNAQTWISGKSFNVDTFVLVGSSRVYKCVAKGPGNTSSAPIHTQGIAQTSDGYKWEFISMMVEPTWNADPNNPNDTVDALGNTWRRNVYDPNYEVALFEDCKFEFGRNTYQQFIMRKGHIDFVRCKLDITCSSSGDVFAYLGGQYDWANKNYVKFTECEFNISEGKGFGSLVANKVHLIRSKFIGNKDIITQSARIEGKEVIIDGCEFINQELKFYGRTKTSVPSRIWVRNSVIYSGNTVRSYGYNSEGLWIAAFKEVHIENNKMYITASNNGIALLARPLVVYVDEFLKFTGNYIESNNSQNKLELYGTYTTSDNNYSQLIVGKAHVHIGNNHAINCDLLLDHTLLSNLKMLTGDGVTDITVPTKIINYIHSDSEPTSGFYVIGQQVYNNTPNVGGCIGWICTKTGVANKTSWKPNTSYTSNVYVNHGGHVYKNISGVKTSGSKSPIHTSGTETDGNINWLYVAPKAEFKMFGLISLY